MLGCLSIRRAVIAVVLKANRYHRFLFSRSTVPRDIRQHQNSLTRYFSQRNMVKVPVSRQKLPSLLSIVWEMFHGFFKRLAPEQRNLSRGQARQRVGV
jgi:hypothetical protein